MDFSSIRRYICDEHENRILSGEWRNASLSELPHVTECAQHVDFSWTPTLFLLLFCPIVFYDLHRSVNPHTTSFSPITYRISICVILVMDLTISLIYNMYLAATTEISDVYVYLAGDAVQYIGLCLALVLLVASRNRGLVTSGVLFLYWFLIVLCGFPEMLYLLTQSSEKAKNINMFRVVLYLIYYPLSAIQLFLSCFADAPSSKYMGKHECPELYSSFLNQITFSWFTGLAYKGNKKPLERSDLWNLNERDTGSHLVAEFDVNFKPEMQSFQRKHGQKPPELVKPSEHPSILWPVFKTYKFTFIAGALFKLMFDLLQFAAPQLLKYLITFIQEPSQPLWIGVGISVMMFLVAFFQSMILHQYFHMMFRLGMNIRSVLTAAVYKKAMNLSNNARKNKTVGEIVNLMSVDIQRFQDMTTFVMLFWSAPLQVSLSIYFLYQLLGIVVIAGVVILILMVPLNSYISLLMRKCQVQQMKYKDERLKMMSEVLNGIKVLKLYSWEKSMKKMVCEIRQKEISILRKLAFLNAATTLSWACAPFLVAVLTFGVYVNVDPENNVLTPEVTFVALALFNILRFPLAIFAMIFSQAVQCSVSNKRLKEFFACSEMDPLAIENKHNTEIAISVVDGNFSWDAGDEMNLRNINLSVKRGSLVAVVGRVGSGKSSLLQAILGEMNKRSGNINISGSIAYVPQQAWIQNMSLRDNILFNRPNDTVYYEQVVEACALRQDINSLGAKDRTEIGEKGINLSGGQKQRVSLARAVYARADIVLLDDPLSAVDAHVGKHIFENVISSSTGILNNTTRILITHGLHYLKYCDQIIVFKEGAVSETGTYRELMNRQGAFSELIEEFLVEEAKNRGRSVSFGEDAADVNEILREIDQINPGQRKRIESQISRDLDILPPSPPPSPPLSPRNSVPLELVDQEKTANEIPLTNINQANGDEKEALLVDIPNKAKLMEKEKLETGKVSWAVYMTYLKAIGLPISLLFITVYIFSSILGVGSNLWLAQWSDDARRIQQSENGSTETNIRLAIYATLGMGQALFVCAASVIMALGMVQASKYLHEGMLSNTLHSPMSFFDTTPLGRIINRFGKDIEAIDNTVPHSIRSMIAMVFNVIATISVILYATPSVAIPMIFVTLIYVFFVDVDVVDSRLPSAVQTFVGALVQSFMILFVPIYATAYVALPIVPVIIIYIFVLRFYVSTSRQLKRLESASKSPIFSHFQESIQGAASIRAYKVMDKFIEESQKRVDENLSTYYPSIVANRWLAVRLELVGNLIVLFSALFASLFRDFSGLSAGLVGLSVSYALNITQTLNWAVRMTSELETNIVAVERIKEYSETPTEGNPDSVQVESNWPSKGEVTIKNYSLRYRPGLDLVLKNVTAHINPMEKVGIVGRTGAGKSSLTMALFRIVESDGGFIEIDGKNISMLSLEDLRSRLTIVPQDPVLFSGNLRMNLDPFDAFGDEAIWNALKNAHLESFVSSLPEKLFHKITEGGENLSVGQRQLLCLARALLRKTKILILDEAAAAVDMETDVLLQKTIREQFKDCTVLTIAHRLNTVMDSDRLLVLDKGEVAQFDSPARLLQDSTGIFYSMAKDAGIV